MGHSRQLADHPTSPRWYPLARKRSAVAGGIRGRPLSVQSGGATDTPIRKVLGLTGMAVCFVLTADGIAMLLPGPSSSLGGAAILAIGVAGLRVALPRFLSPSGRAFSSILAARFGLFVLPVLVLPIALLWYVTSPDALSWWFAVAWAAVWSVCLGFSASLPCPECSRPFGRRGWSLQLTSSACAHCGADPRGRAA